MSALRGIAEAMEFDIPMFHGPPDERFLGTESAMMGMAGVYLLSLTVLKLSVAGSPALSGVVKSVSVVNNVVMCLYSAYCFVGVTCVLLANLADLGYDMRAPVCDPSRRFMRGMDYWCYLFYLSKFWEWIDTWILVLKGKGVWPPENSQYLLHVFHHTVTASIAWLAWRAEFNVAWLGVLTNSFVHTPMYAYYFATDFWKGVRKFGIFITPIQILQFIVCLLLLTPETINSSCGSTPRSLYWMWFTYITFLGFFVKMFRDKKAARVAAKKAARYGETSDAKGRIPYAVGENGRKDKLG